MNSEKERLERLLALARRARPESAGAERSHDHGPEPDLAPPLGFSTRVAARWASTPRSLSVADVWERLSWWGSAAALVACAIAFVLHSSQPEPTGFDLLLTVNQEAEPF